MIWRFFSLSHDLERGAQSRRESIAQPSEDQLRHLIEDNVAFLLSP